ncbi:hypothetical protein BKA70DRAFT_1276349 [Coprinopsis sp. MPI-PUGE-AT-0042]|nr:hypothetical protein BKA70DRAFT_1276349 [Coprinopsis sp. MPI-PUGE-AT-0042]
MPKELSALGPIDPNSVSAKHEEEKEAPWIIRKLVGSMTGRIVLSSYESLRAAGTSVVCLSPTRRRSSSPCIRFRDLAVHTVIVATGGMAAVAAPVMVPVSEAAVSSFGSTIIVDLGLSAGFALTTKVANDLVFSKPLNKLIPIHSDRLETTGIKELTITLKFKLALEDAALGFYRGSLHSDKSLFSSVIDYVSVEKGWFSPYLFASARRPAIPRTMKPDIIFLSGKHCSKNPPSVITLCDDPTPVVATEEVEEKKMFSKLTIPSLSNMFDRSRTPSPEPELAPVVPPPVPRRMVILVVGLKPFRGTWASSKRPWGKRHQVPAANGCISIVIPVKTGAPLVAWDTMTLDKLWEVTLPAEGCTTTEDGRFEGIIAVMCEYLELCVDWERFRLPHSESVDVADGVVIPTEYDKEVDHGRSPGEEEKQKREALRDAVTLLVAGAIRSKQSKEVKDAVDEDRSGIAMWRIP